MHRHEQRRGPSSEQRHTSIDDAFRYACRLLGYRDRSSAELTRRLQERGFSPEAIDGALRKLRESALIDDERFARVFRDSLLKRGRSLRLIAAELRQKHGIDTLPPIGMDEDPDAEILAILKRRFGPLPDTPTVRRRMVSFLVRRGFDYGYIRRLATALRKPLPPEECAD